MKESYTKIVHKYLRTDKKFPHTCCPGCGNGIVLASLIRAIHELGLDKDEIVIGSGVGCAGTMTAYMDFNTLHVTHGRALTFLTGVKLAKPELTVIAVMGDGDALAIGGNHFIHAARRNIDITSIVVNNMNYGMTGGQYSPTTPQDSYTTTTQYGCVENEFPITDIAIAAGASFVARGSVYHVRNLEKMIRKAIQKKGFSVVEVVSNCHTQFGRKNDMEDPKDMLKWIKKTVKPEILVDIEKPIYNEEYDRVRDQAKNTP